MKLTEEHKGIGLSIIVALLIFKFLPNYIKITRELNFLTSAMVIIMISLVSMGLVAGFTNFFGTTFNKKELIMTLLKVVGILLVINLFFPQLIGLGKVFIQPVINAIIPYDINFNLFGG